MSEDYERFAGPDACCTRCGDQIGHVRGHFYEDCLDSLRDQRDAARKDLERAIEVAVSVSNDAERELREAGLL